VHDDLMDTAAPGALDGRAGRLFEGESAKMWRSLMLHVGDREMASDAVAEAFAQLLRRGGEVRDPRAWVWRAAYRIADREAAKRPAGSVEPPNIGYEMPDATVDLVRALRTLSPMQRASLVLHHVADLPVADVASILGSTRSAVTVHLHRGRQRLREILDDEDD
jgi:RNA polymerase sigma-70 factor, ECF subfamily